MTALFGPFALDAETRELRRGTGIVYLTPKAFDLLHLHLLVTEAPRVMTWRELHERLWPIVFVSDARPTGLVKGIRPTAASRARWRSWRTG